MVKLCFDGESHEYSVDGLVVPSVTQILGKIGLGTDYSKVNKKVLKNAADRGTFIHKVTADLDNGYPVEYISDEVSEGVELWEQFKKDYGFVPAHIELPVYSSTLNVAGTIDRIGMIGDEFILLDLKTGYKIGKATRFQTAGYELCYNHWLNLDIKFRRMAVHLRPPGYNVVEFTDDEDLEVFKAAAKLYPYLF